MEHIFGASSFNQPIAIFKVQAFRQRNRPHSWKFRCCGHGRVPLEVYAFVDVRVVFISDRVVGWLGLLPLRSRRQLHTMLPTRSYPIIIEVNGRSTIDLCGCDSKSQVHRNDNKRNSKSSKTENSKSLAASPSGQSRPAWKERFLSKPSAKTLHLLVRSCLLSDFVGGHERASEDANTSNFKQSRGSDMEILNVFVDICLLS